MRSLILSFLALASFISPAAHELVCAGAFRGSYAPVDSAEFRKYAPERNVDILHIAIDITPNFRERSIHATTTLRFKPLNHSVTEVRLNAQDLRIQDIVSKGAKLAAHQNTDTELVLTYSEPLPTDRFQELAVTYSAFPRKGLYFRTKEMGYKPEDEHLFTQGEDIEARHWFPCFDAPNEKFTSEIICRVPSEMTVLSNGKLVSEKPADNNLKAVHWFQDKPHVSYLISLVAGHFKKVEDKYKEIDLAFYTPASQIDYAQTSFAETKEMMDFFEKEIGVPYPWAKYYQVCVQDFMWGGMENTSISTLTDRTLFPKETENIRSSQGLVAHELAHQWFGDLVTCEDWSQIWLNEGFATYYAHLYNGHKDGSDEFLYGLYNSASGFIDRTVAQDSRPVVFRRYDQPTELFGYLVYPKGAWILHMLRTELGPDLFRKCIKTYLERHQYSTVVTHDLISVIEEISGREFDRFFDQWVFHPHHPELQVKYSWDQHAKLARVTISQTQQLTNDVALFHFPLKLRFKSKSATIDRVFQIKDKQTDLFIPLDTAPETFRVDPDYALLAKVTVDLPRPMLVAQLKDESDLIGRMFAVNQVGKGRDAETIKLLKERLQKDPFFAVRNEAAEALRHIHTDDSLQALLDSTDQSDARVRNKVTSEIGSFFNEKAAAHSLNVLAREKNPDIRHNAVRGLGAYPGEQYREPLLAALKSDSYEDIVADGAILALRARRDTAAIEPMITELKNPKNDFNSRDFSAALQTVATLASDLENKDSAYEFLVRYANDLREPVRIGAMRALGILKDERAVGVLTNFTSGPVGSAETLAATRAIEQIRADRPTGNELGSLRTEVLDLKKQNDELKKSFEELKKKIEARDSQSSTQAPASTPRRTTPSAGKRR
ncbi:MAG TPA: M1 family aminopeptidase [Verrucomicrobiae bacterium]